MTDAQYLSLALSFPEAREGQHFGKVDIRVNDKIFAGFDASGTGYVKLTPDQQQMVCAAEPALVRPIKGGWGIKGWTLVDHRKADQNQLRSLLTLAWKNTAPKRLGATLADTPQQEV